MKETVPRKTHTEDVVGGNGLSRGEEHASTLQAPVAPPDFESEIEITAPPRRRRWRVLVSIVLALLVLVGLLFFLFRPTQSLATATVRRGTIISTVETTGKLQAEQRARLSFRSSGRVEKVLVKQGDVVEAGQTLAELDTAAVQRQLNEANTQMEIAKLKLQQASEGARTEDIAAATANLNAAIAGLNQVKAGSRAEDIAIAQSRLDAAKAERARVAANAANAKEQARIAVEQARNLVATAQDAYDRIKRENASVPTGQLTEVQKSAEEQARRDLENAKGKLAQAQSDYDTAQKSETSLVAAADAQVKEAQSALDRAKAGASPEQIKEAEAKVAAAQAALDKLSTGPTSTELAILEQQITLAQIAVDSAQAQIADAQLITPISGTVLEINLQVGEVVGALQPLATVADLGSLRIKADVDEIDVGKVSVGQPVTVTLDAYPGVKMPGRIEALAPGATLKQGSTVYQATVGFNPVEGVVPREGMAANVEITAQRKENVLLLPNRAFETVGRRQFVTLVENGATRKVEVETGLSNATDTEVVSGVSEGQVVVVK